MRHAWVLRRLVTGSRLRLAHMAPPKRRFSNPRRVKTKEMQHVA
jgi:hypothetical protein